MAEETKSAEKANPLDRYKLILKEVEDGLHVQAKDKESNNLFQNTFSRDLLKEEYELEQNVAEIIKILNTAKEAPTKEHELSIGYFDADKELSDDDPLQQSYAKGDCLYLILSVNEKWMSGEYPFKLLISTNIVEEDNVLFTIIDDLQEEVDGLTLLVKKLERRVYSQGLVSFKGCSLSKDERIQWKQSELVLSVMPKAMAKVSENGEQIIVQVSGIYRISVRFADTKAGSSDAENSMHLTVNKKKVASGICRGSNTLTMVEIVSLKEGDIVEFYSSAGIQGIDPAFNNLIVERIGDLN